MLVAGGGGGFVGAVVGGWVGFGGPPGFLVGVAVRGATGVKGRGVKVAVAGGV